MAAATVVGGTVVATAVVAAAVAAVVVARAVVTTAGVVATAAVVGAGAADEVDAVVSGTTEVAEVELPFESPSTARKANEPTPTTTASAAAIDQPRPRPRVGRTPSGRSVTLGGGGGGAGTTRGSVSCEPFGSACGVLVGPATCGGGSRQSHSAMAATVDIGDAGAMSHPTCLPYEVC